MRVAKAFSLVELLLVVAIIGILIGVLLPVMVAARRAAQAMHCAANLQQLGQAMIMYVHDNSGILPPSDAMNWTEDHSDHVTWDDLLEKYLGIQMSPQVRPMPYTPSPSPILQCPAEIRSFSADIPDLGPVGIRSYAMTWAAPPSYQEGTGGVGAWGYMNDTLPRLFAVRLSDAHHATTTLLLVECQTVNPGNPRGQNLAGSPWLASVVRPVEQQWKLPRAQVHSQDKPAGPPIHGSKWNYLFCDGHVQLLAPEETVVRTNANDNPLLLSNGMWLRQP